MAEGEYKVLARKWRPQSFEDVIGQEHVTRTLKNAIVAGRIHHAFLFIGSRGIGKTTTARILCKALNCLSSDKPTPEPCGVCTNCVSIGEGNNIDVIEIDGASNNGVENVREIRDNIRMVPSSSRYKVYIIDEVHQLSSSAFNALLKTLEEPPLHGVFILATTEAHKIPATIISRCQRFDFRRVALDRIVALLRNIVVKEGKKATDDALHAIAQAAEGGVRDAESILDQLISYCDGEIRFDDVYDVLGLVDRRLLHELCRAILDKDIPAQLRIVEDIVAGGKDLSQFVQEILQHFRNLLVCKTGEAARLLALPEDEIQVLSEQAGRFPLTHLIKLVEQFAQLTGEFDSQLAQRIALEALLIRISKAGVDVSIDTVLEKLLQLGEGHAPARGGPNPPEAGAPPVPRRAAPAKPRGAPAPAAEPEPLTLTADNLRQLWPAILERVREASLSLAVWLGQGVAAGIEGDTLVLQYAAGQTRARETVEQPDQRRALESALAASTRNVRTYRTELQAGAASPRETKAEYNPQQPFYPTVNPEEARKVMADPRIAQVLDVFKGRIADIRHDVSLAHREGD
ncbi:MAG: DNA polymerase III subunit gamma/tau [Candidatus Hydrogenedentes bacterium]|nr:DNA polymerase III subunit gamma/tau [Candidatus Hydrogenedentota bacterium]